jgi:sugar/nucleoside kinase (ribokinase family)
MSNRRPNVPTICGAGFVALDVVVDRDSGAESLYAGGTCGNVLAIMAFLGWHSTPIARLDEDAAGALVREDLERWGVDLSQVGLQPRSATPIVIEEIYRSQGGMAKHRYVWTCPDCGGYLPQFRPVLSKSTEALLTMQSPEVFFFDRVSRGSIDLAKHFSKDGAVIVFEPSGSSDPRLFREAIRICHVLKYSAQRVRAFADLLKLSKALLEIETLGDEGLRYRTTLPLIGGHGWKSLPSFHVDDVKDAAGSGDWCTAGLLSKIARHGQQGFNSTTPKSLDQALQFGQALSAWNCRFPAARGGMYTMNRTAVLRAAEKIIAGSALKARLVSTKRGNTQAALFCPSCSEPGSRQHLPTKRKIYRAV